MPELNWISIDSPDKPEPYRLVLARRKLIEPKYSVVYIDDSGAWSVGPFLKAGDVVAWAYFNGENGDMEMYAPQGIW